jgi:acetyl esterase
MRVPSLRTKIDTQLLRAAMNAPPRVQRLLSGRAVVRDGQTLAPETQLMLRLQVVAREPRVEDLPLPTARAALVRQAQMIGGDLPIGAVRELVVPGADGPLKARLYTPLARLRDKTMPTLLFVHGGGYMFGDLDSHDAPCRFLAENAGVQVLSIEYRLAPEHPFPAAAEDVAAAFRWLVAHATEIGADVDKLAIGGDSAGGNLAAVTAITAAREGLPLAFQLLVYPGTDFTTETRSRKLFVNGFYLNKGFIDSAQQAYLPGAADRADPRASVLLSADFPKGLAPAYVVTAGFDPLRDEGEAYAQLLAEHGVTVDAKRYPSMIHGFLNFVGCGHEAPAYNREIAERLRLALR